MAKKTIVGMKRKFEFRTPQKHASPFVFKRKRHQVENDDNDKNERIKHMQVHDNELRQKYFKSHEATNNPHAEIFDALCAIVERTIDHTASSTTSSGETNKQLLHVLDAAAVIIKTEFASAATSNTDDESGSNSPHHDSVHTLIVRWKKNLKESSVVVQDDRPFPCVEIPAKLAHDQKELTKRVQTVGTKMHFLESSLYEVERMVHVSDALRSALFDAFHASEFQGYQHMQSPKDAIKALMALFD
ncbi:hypothetical protein Ae201684P_007459 [Aphanomyces euteiches]|nr:hypothetical protein Ae201684P_007459 [Aphanomyces euteiches]